MTSFNKNNTNINTTICFRVDGDSTIGLGHVVRSKALASVFDEMSNVNVIWASCGTSDNSPNAVEKLYDRSMKDEDLKLPNGSACDLNEAEEVGKWARKSNATWIVIDHYKITDEYLNHLYTTMNNDNNNNSTMNNIKIMIMDDHQIRVTNVAMRLAPMQVFEKFNDIKTNKDDDNVENLIGPQYLLLRPDFASIAKKYNNRKNYIRSGTIICFGGADTLGMTKNCIEMLLNTPGVFFDQRRKEKLYVLASDKMCDMQNLNEIIKQYSDKLGVDKIERKSWVDANDMATLLSSCSYAFVSSSGVGVETVAMKCPCTVVCWIDNQINHGKIIKGLGGGYVANNIEEMITQLSSSNVDGTKNDNNNNVTMMDQEEMEIIKTLDGATIDPYGAWRVASKMLNIDLLKNMMDVEKEQEEEEEKKNHESCKKIEEQLRAGFDNIEFLSVEDLSDGCGDKFKIIIVSDVFEGVNLVDRHRMVNGSNGVLKNIMDTVHAMQLKTWTIKQYQKKMNK